MKKRNNKGFLLAETLVVSVFVLSTLVYIFVQFQTIRSNYATSFSYNTVNGLYNAAQVRKFLLENAHVGIQDSILHSSPYLDLTDCPTSAVYESDFCLQIMNSIGRKRVILTNNDLTSLKDYVNDHKIFSEKMTDFIKRTSTDATSSYRLFIEYDDNTFATIQVTL